MPPTITPLATLLQMNSHAQQSMVSRLCDLAQLWLSRIEAGEVSRAGARQAIQELERGLRVTEGVKENLNPELAELVLRLRGQLALAHQLLIVTDTPVT